MIEFWFELGSNYSYLSVMRIEALAARHGITITWRPFLLGPIFKSFGWDSSPFVLQKAKGSYVWRDMARQCEKYGLPWTRPTQFPRRALLPMRVATLGAEQPWMGAYCKKIMQMNFVEDRDIDTLEAVSNALEQLGLPAAQIIADAQSDEQKHRLRLQTETAQARGIFGAPTFFVRDEMFWGDDRLEDALAFAASAG
ncbi:2-hydroxychromene-2-carboxylate isomerase [Dyella tabacisoli]|nr:2-hydroxychromene-2-carboxylate isomerase [Dyella tabacisoli]